MRPEAQTNPDVVDIVKVADRAKRGRSGEVGNFRPHFWAALPATTGAQGKGKRVSDD
jgi:hypothetical protein